MLIVRPLDMKDENVYEAFLLYAPQATFFHTLVYRDLLHEFTGASASHLAAWDDERLVGALPLFIQGGVLGPVINSSPFFGSFGGFLLDPSVDRPAEVRGVLIDAWQAFAKHEGAKISTIIHSPFATDQAEAIAQYSYDFEDYRIAQVKFLPKPGPDLRDRLLASLESRCRWSIRRAEKRGVHVIRSMDEELLRELFVMHRTGLSVIGGLYKPWEFFSTVLRLFGHRDDCHAYYGIQSGRVVACLLVFYFGDTVEYYTPCTLEEARRDQPMSLLIFQSMMDAVEAGYRRYNFGGTWSTQEGVYLFKRSWGTIDLPYTYTITLHEDNSPFLEASSELLKQEYPWFYVIPFSELSDDSAQ